MQNVAAGSGSDDSAFQLPAGVWPTMITPFLEDGSVDDESLQYLVNWFIKNGVAGLFTVCLSSEMYDLSDDERLQLARAIKKHSAGRVPVVASGTFGGSVEDMAKFTRLMAKEVDAVVVLVNQLAKEDEDDDVWRRNVQRLLELTPGVPLGLYECPVPYKRFVAPDNLQWALSTNRFYFHKDTQSMKKPIEDKLAVIQNAPKSAFRFFNANLETLQFSLRKGADGFSGISANFCPSLIVWLCAHPEHDRAEEVQEFLGLSQNLINWKYPACAKMYHQQLGSPVRQVSKAQPQQVFSHMELEALDQLRCEIQEVAAMIGLQ